MPFATGPTSESTSLRTTLHVSCLVGVSLTLSGCFHSSSPGNARACLFNEGDTSWMTCLAPNTTVRLSSGRYLLDRHLQLPDGLHLEGDGVGRTIIEATTGVENGCGEHAQVSGNPDTRIGFIFGNDNYVGKFTYVAKDDHRWQGYNGAALCGGAVFETPGCSDAYCNSSNIGDARFGNGGAHNIMVEDIDIVGSSWNTAPQLAVFVTQTRDLSHPSHDIHIRRIKMHHSWADGINLHGAVYNALVEECDLGFQGDDNLAVWSAGDLATNITFKSNTLSQTQSTNPNKAWGNCVALYGGSDIKVLDTQCYGTNDGGVKLASTFQGAFSNTSEVLVQDMSVDNGKPLVIVESVQNQRPIINHCPEAADYQVDPCFVTTGCTPENGIVYNDDAFSALGRGWYCKANRTLGELSEYAACCIHSGCSKAAWNGFVWKCAHADGELLI